MQVENYVKSFILRICGDRDKAFVFLQKSENVMKVPELFRVT